MTKKTSIDDIKGIVKCEPIDSVEEVRKLRGRDGMTDKRFDVKCSGDVEYSHEVMPCANCILLKKENEELKHRLAISEKASFVTALEKENEQLKQFINELTSRDGKIWLSSGYVYDVKKVLKDGDVE